MNAEPKQAKEKKPVAKRDIKAENKAFAESQIKKCQSGIKTFDERIAELAEAGEGINERIVFARECLNRVISHLKLV